MGIAMVGKFTRVLGGLSTVLLFFAAFTSATVAWVHGASPLSADNGLTINKTVDYGSGNDMSAINSFIWAPSQVVTGKCSNPVSCYLNRFELNDQADATSATNGQIDWWYVDNVKAQSKGNKTGSWVNITVRQQPATVAGHTNFVASSHEVHAIADAPTGGTGSAIWSEVNYATMTNAGYLSLQSIENDIACNATCNPHYETGVSVVLLNGHTTGGDRQNVAYTVGAQAGATPTIDTAYGIGGYQAVNALASTAYIMRFLPNAGIGSGPTITGGIDLSLGTFTSGPAFGSKGFTVDGPTGKVATVSLQTTTIYSVAGTALPTCNGAAEGTHAAVSDAQATTFHTTYTGSSTNHMSVYCDGTNWYID